MFFHLEVLIYILLSLLMGVIPSFLDKTQSHWEWLDVIQTKYKLSHHIPQAGPVTGAHEVCSEGCGHGFGSPGLWFVVSEGGPPDWVSRGGSSRPLPRRWCLSKAVAPRWNNPQTQAWTQTHTHTQQISPVFPSCFLWVITVTWWVNCFLFCT